jgi:CBS domain-containing protein
MIRNLGLPAACGHQGREIKVRDAMTSDPLTIDRNMSLGEAIGLMKQRAIRHLPMVDRTTASR